MSMNPQELEELRKSGNPLGDLFITHDEAMQMKERIFDEKVEECKLIEKENKELLSRIGNTENKIGHIMRDFELKDPPTDSQKEYMNKFWKYVIKEVPLRFSSYSKTYRKEEERRVKKIQSYKDKIEKLETQFHGATK